MTTLANRPATALLVVDVQVGVVTDAHARDAVVGRIVALVDRAREAATPVVWVQHADADLPKGGEAWRLVPELVVAPGEPVIDKAYGDAFEDTGLEEVLARLGVGRLIVAGAETDACIRSTLHGAFVRGYDTILVADAHTTGDRSAWGAPAAAQVIAHTNLYWSWQSAPGRTAGTILADEVRFDAPPPRGASGERQTGQVTGDRARISPAR